MRFSNQSTRQQRLREDILDKNQITCHLCLTEFFFFFVTSCISWRAQISKNKQHLLSKNIQKLALKKSSITSSMINSHNTNKQTQTRIKRFWLRKVLVGNIFNGNQPMGLLHLNNGLYQGYFPHHTCTQLSRHQEQGS